MKLTSKDGYFGQTLNPHPKKAPNIMYIQHFFRREPKTCSLRNGGGMGG